jgi:hypothetical protein
MPTGQTNLLEAFNPDFEAPAAAGQIPGWTVAYGKAEIATNPRTGKQSLHITGNCKLYSNKLIRVEPGYLYHLAGWGKVKDFKFIHEGFYGAGIGMEELNADKQIQGNWYPMYAYLQYVEGDSDWGVSGGLTCRPKESTVYIRPTIFVWATPQSQLWVDDVEVWKTQRQEMKAETTLNVVENHSFEVRYEMGLRANGYEFADKVGANAICVEDVKHSGLASMKMTGECTAFSGMEFLGDKPFRAGIVIKTDHVAGGKAFARLIFFDADRKEVKRQTIAELSGTADWTPYSVELKALDPSIRYGRWEFGLEKGATGTAWFDDLSIHIPTTYQPFPVREKDPSKGTVVVDCSQRKSVFMSPLSAYDHHNIDRAYSESLGTAGQFVEGPGRWYQERVNLGFKYVRLHHTYQCNVGVMEKDANGDWRPNFGHGRKNWPKDDESFGPIASYDADGKLVTDFRAIQYVLDKALLVGGCKPILCLEPVPKVMARHQNESNGPHNYKDWEELNYRFVKFLLDTYGEDEVRTWMFETGNEPGTQPEWHGFKNDPSDTFLRLQDHIVAGVTRAFPQAFIAGPSGSAGDSSMDEMLDHCAEGINQATGQKGTQLDAISYHGYLGGYSGDISWRQAEDQILRYQGYIDRYYQKTGKRLQLFNTEYTPIYFDGGRDPKHPTHEQNNHIQAVATLHAGFFSHRLGVSLMAFFFQSPIYMAYTPAGDNTPEFQGLPTCITFHGIFAPVCRAHQMMSWLNGGTQVSAEAEKDPIYALAVVDKDTIKVLCYSFESNPNVKYTTKVSLSIDPADLGTAFDVTRYTLSATESNSWFLAQKMKLTMGHCKKDPSIVDKINTDSELKPRKLGRIETKDGKLHLQFELPAYSATLYVFKKTH